MTIENVNDLLLPRNLSIKKKRVMLEKNQINNFLIFLRGFLGELKYFQLVTRLFDRIIKSAFQTTTKAKRYGSISFDKYRKK